VAFLVSAGLAYAQPPGCRLTRAQGEGGVPLLILENPFVRFTLSPAQGGACTSFIVKRTGDELTAEGTNRRMFQEMVHGYKSDWINAPYECQVLSQGPEEIVVRMWKSGKTDVVRYCRFTKTIRMRSDSSAIRVELEFLNERESMTDIYVPIRFFNSTEFGAKPTDYFLPTSSGVKQYPYRKRDASQEVFNYDAPRGWLAGTDPEGKEGFAYDLETCYPHLMCLYLWRGSNGYPTTEWMLRTAKVANGESLRFTYSFTPFRGVPQIAGVGGGMVTGFEGLADSYAPGQKMPLRVRGYLSESKSGELELRALRLPERTVQVLGARSLKGGPDSVAALDFDFTPTQSGTYVIAGEIKVDGKVAHEFERPVTVGRPSAEYVFQPKEKRLGDPEERFLAGTPVLVRQLGKDPLEWTGGVTTPHIPWAKPYAGGKTKALILCSYLQGREVLELAQRMDLDLATATIETGGSNVWTPWWRHGGQTAFSQAKVVELLKGEHDVIVLGAYGVYNDEIIKLLDEKVKKGAGLVYIMPWRVPDRVAQLLPGREIPNQPNARPETKGRWAKQADHFLTQGIPFGLLPETLYRRYEETPGASVLARVGNDPLLTIRDAKGTGRVVLLSYVNSYFADSQAGLTPWFLHAPAETIPYWEYHHSLLARCVLWAARKDPAVDFGKLDAAANAQSKFMMSVDLANRGEPFKAILEVEVRDLYGNPETRLEKEASVPAGRSAFSVEDAAGAPLKEGGHIAHLFLKREGKVVNWAATAFQVDRPLRISRVEMPDKIFRAGEALGAFAEVEAGTLQEVELRADVTDAFGRITAAASQTVQAQGKARIPLRMTMPEPLSADHTLRVQLWSANTLMSEKRLRILAMPKSFDERQWGDYEFVSWGAGPSEYPYLRALKAQAGRRAGVTTMGLPTGPARYLYKADPGVQKENFRNGFKIAPLTFMQGLDVPSQTYYQQKAAYAKTKDKKYLCRQPSLSDPAFVRSLRAELREVLSPLRELAPQAYCYSDEGSLTRGDDLFDFDFSPNALADFRQWLKEEYGSLDRLNAEWETAFAKWEDVTPMTMDEVEGRRSKAPWADHRTFMEKSLADFYVSMRGVLREIDPQAVAGICGNQRPGASNGMDYSRLMKTFDFLYSYIDSGLLEIMRSLGRIPMAPCNGYGRESEFLKYEAWGAFLHGSRGVLYFADRNFLNPNLTPRRDAQELSDIVRLLNNGLARLAWNAERQAQVAIHYSQSSLHMAALEGKQDAFSQTRIGWLDLVEDMGLQADFVTPEQIGGGALAKYSTLVLPYSCALSDKEAGAIRAFVKNGGLLLTDAFAGIYDEHGKPYREGILNDVLGVALAYDAKTRKNAGGDLEFSADYKSCQVKGQSLYASIADRGLRVEGGKALGTLKASPAFVVASFGNGHAVYLNMFLSSYSNMRKRGGEETLRNIMANLFSLGAAQAPAKVIGEKGPLTVCQVVQYNAGPIQYFGVLRDYRNPELKSARASVVFPSARHTYDALDGKYFGQVDRAETTLSPGEARIFSRLAYQVRSVAAALPGRVKPGAEVRYKVTLDTAGAKPGLHVVHVEVTGPDGEARPCYSQNVNVDGGQGEGAFALALNDKAGHWSLRLRDAATGVTGQAVFDVAP